MNRKDMELEKALDNLFCDVSVDSNQDETNIRYEVIDKTDDDIYFGNNYSSQNNKIINNNIDTEYKENIENDTMSFSEVELITKPEIDENADELESTHNEKDIEENDTIIFSTEEKEKINDFVYSNNVTNEDKNENNENRPTYGDFEEQNVQNGDDVDTNLVESNLDIKKIIIYFMIGILFGLVLIFFLLSSDKEKEVGIINCSFAAEDDNYKITEQYKITHVDDIISYVEGTYLYTAKTEEFENQVEFIKKEKLPAIINSNGMSGFTYVPETASNYFKVQTYLDYDAFDLNAIKNINQDTTPLSFFNINVNKKYVDLKNNLEKKGFKCTLNK